MQAAGGTALTTPDGAGPRAPQAPRRLGVLLGVAVFAYLADVITKVVVVATLSHRPPIRLLGGFLTLRLLRNSGAAFSIGTSMTVVFTLIAVAVIFVILRMSRRLRSLPWAIALGLLLGGATGNLTDRIFRAPGVFRGDVVDWIQLPHWPVFNLADSAIVCGVALWALLLARGVPMNGQHAVAEQEPDAAGAAAAGQGGAGAVPAGGQEPPAQAAPGGLADGRLGATPQPGRMPGGPRDPAAAPGTPDGEAGGGRAAGGGSRDAGG